MADDLQEKNSQEKEMRWRFMAERMGYRCKLCGNIPKLSDQDLYLETGLCGQCHSTDEKAG